MDVNRKHHLFIKRRFPSHLRRTSDIFYSFSTSAWVGLVMISALHYWPGHSKQRLIGTDCRSDALHVNGHLALWRGHFASHDTVGHHPLAAHERRLNEERSRRNGAKSAQWDALRRLCM